MRAVQVLSRMLALRRLCSVMCLLLLCSAGVALRRLRSCSCELRAVRQVLVAGWLLRARSLVQACHASPCTAHVRLGVLLAVCPLGFGSSGYVFFRSRLRRDEYLIVVRRLAILMPTLFRYAHRGWVWFDTPGRFAVPRPCLWVLIFFGALMLRWLVI